MNANISAENFHQWSIAVQSGAVDRVIALYNDNLTLLPTMAATTVRDIAGCTEYFTFFCSLHPEAKIVEEYTYELSAESYAHVGVYQFTVDGAAGREKVNARFSMVWQRVGDTWKILHHHSSRMPVVLTQ